MRIRRSPCLPWLCLLWLGIATQAAALEFGVEARTLVQASDNVDQADAGAEQEGSLGFVGIGVFGEQSGRLATGAFSGEIDVRTRLDEDDGIDTLSRFLGAVEFRLTPRVLSWYVGDVLGSVRVDDTDQPVNDFRTQRRNVFVTGPQAEWQIDAANRLDARLLYLHQSGDGDQLETLYNGFVEFQRERIAGRRIGLRLSDVFTDASRVGEGEDANRVSASGYIERERGAWSLGGELGGTRYDTDDQSVDGLVAQVEAVRRLGPVSAATLRLRRDLNDRTLGTVSSLLGSGSAAQQDAGGIFEETRLEALYELKGSVGTAEAGIGAATLDYRVVDGGTLDDALADDQDQVETYGFVVGSRSLTPRLRAQGGVRYERERFDNLPDEADSLLGTLGITYQLTRELQLDASYLFDRSSGIRSDEVDGLVELDRTENRVGLGLRWAPPSRASQDLTIELKSLIR